MPISKTKAQRIHAKRRAVSRFGLSLNRHDLRAFVRQIQTGKAALIEKQSLRVGVWLVTLPDARQARVVYDNKRKTIVTFLPSLEAATSINAVDPSAQVLESGPRA